MALQRFYEGMGVLFTLVHRERGPLATFDTPAEAAQEMVRVVQGEPEWLHDLRIERREFKAAATGLDGNANLRS
jgi:hypothetical protein